MQILVSRNAFMCWLTPGENVNVIAGRPSGHLSHLPVDEIGNSALRIFLGVLLSII